MIEILKLKIVNAGAKVASFAVRRNDWKGFTLDGWSYFESGDKSWVMAPNIQYEADGKKKYYELAFYPTRDAMDAYKAKIKELVQEGIAKMRVNPPAPKEEQGELPF